MREVVRRHLALRVSFSGKNVNQEYRPGNKNDLSTVIWERLDPGRGMNPLAVMKYRRDDGWNDAPPKRKPGDLYVLSGSTAGAIVGGALAFPVGFFAIFLGVVAGGVAGALAGSYVRWLKVRRRERARR